MGSWLSAAPVECQRELLLANQRVSFIPFPSYKLGSSDCPGAVKGATKRTLDGEDRSEIVRGGPLTAL